MNPAVSVALAVSLVLGSAVVASADPIVFSNGPRDGNTGPGSRTGRCDSQPNVCAGTGSWTVYDDFSLSSQTTVTGFSFSDQLADGSLNSYLRTEWSIWASDPLAGGTPSASGTTIARISADGSGLIFTATGLNVPLSASQTYWLGTSNVFAQRTTTGRDTATGMNRPGYKVSDGLTNNLNLPGDTFFTISGNATPSPTPEPASLLLLATGIAGFFGLRSRHGNPAA